MGVVVEARVKFPGGRTRIRGADVSHCPCRRPRSQLLQNYLSRKRSNVEQRPACHEVHDHVSSVTVSCIADRNYSDRGG
jgi:hypothetical protein